MKTIKLSIVVGLGIFFIVTAPIHSHIKCPFKIWGTTNDKCPHLHVQFPEEAESHIPVMPISEKQRRLERERKAQKIRQLENRKMWKREQAIRKQRAVNEYRAKENERIYQKKREYARRQKNERINRAQRRQEQESWRNVDRGRNYISQPRRNEEIMRAEDNFSRALRKIRGQQ
ncbi:MAG: hypothetical protein COB07_12750 [Sulfurovum sp.]|nr:MAG: hypothetical protein COB07_12750 [Sulfurovum sp.]